MTEAACVINQSGIKPSRLCRRHGQSVFQKLKHNLTGRGGLRRHIIQLCEIGVAFVVVNIDFLRCFLENFRRIPQASLVTAVQYEEQLRKPCILCRANQMSIQESADIYPHIFQNDLHLLPCLSSAPPSARQAPMASPSGLVCPASAIVSADRTHSMISSKELFAFFILHLFPCVPYQFC